MKTMKNMAARVVTMSLFGVAAIGCSDDASSSTATTDGADGTDGTDGTTPAFTGGNFQLTTQAVDDECLEGSLSIVFMPEGDAKPYKLANTTELPASDALPASYEISLQAPFTELPVKVEADGSNMKIADANQTDILVDEDQWADCRANMEIDASITIADDDNVDVNATITVTGWNGSTCPVATSGCTIKLTMTGDRVE